jgi:hypothetical protein
MKGELALEVCCGPPGGTIAVIARCVGKRRLASTRVTALDAVTDPALSLPRRAGFLFG